MKKIEFYSKKTLKLMNVLKYPIKFDNELLDINIAVEQMQSYLKVKGGVPIGPLIQFTRSFQNDNNEIGMEMILMIQCDKYIVAEEPYSVEPVLKVPNALYCRYTGPETLVKLAYDKINLEAFENDIELDGSSYTIFVASDEVEETIIADVFMPRLLY